MTLLELQYFQALAHNLHYTQTAGQLHISQPSLSYAINVLEKEMGVKLFERKKRNVSLTVYGQMFLPYVEQALNLLQNGYDVINQTANNAPQIVHLGYFYSISASMIPSLVTGFYQKEENQKIHFQFTEGSSYEILTQIGSGALDLGFCLHQADWAESIGISRQPLFLTVPANHTLAGKSDVSFNDFAHEPQIMLEHGSNLRSIMDKAFLEFGVIPDIVFEVKECNAALQYVSLGFGVSVLPHIPAMDTDTVFVIPISDRTKIFTRTIYFTCPKNRILSPAVQKVHDYVVQNYAHYS